MGNGVDYISTQLIASIFWLPFFNIGLGVKPMLASAALIVMQCWNAVVDPVVGNISDNARTRWGRRRPFMLAGAVLTAVAYTAIWRVPVDGASDLETILWLSGIGMLFSSCFSIWMMPYYAMQLELTPNYDERTRLMAWCSFAKTITAMLCSWALWLVSRPIFAGFENFSNTLCDLAANISDFEYLRGTWIPGAFADGNADIAGGIKLTSFAIATVILLLGLLPPLFAHERYYSKCARKQERDPFFASIRESAACRPLWMIIGLSFFLVIGSVSLESMWSYINIYYVFGGDISKAAVVAGLKGTTIAIAGVLMLPLLTWLGERFDKKSIVQSMLLMTMGGHLLSFLCITPEHPWLQIIPGIFEMCAISAIWLFVPSMKADIADYDELKTFRRREGSLNAFYSWFIKASLAAAAGTTGLLLTVSGFEATLGSQLPEVLQLMFVLYIACPLGMFIMALVFLYFYPINRAEALRIRSELERRRGRL